VIVEDIQVKYFDELLWNGNVKFGKWKMEVSFSICVPVRKYKG
jgi:hypothetical protein